jgi:uridine kinase
MNKKQEVQMILTRIHSHEYTVKIKDDYYRLTKMEHVQNWDIEKFNPDSVREFDYEITFTTLKECKNYLLKKYTTQEVQ